MKNNYGLIFKKTLPYMLAIASSGLTILAVITSAKAGIKISKNIEEKENEKGGKLDNKEKFKILAPQMVLPVIFTVASVGCTSASFVLTKKRETALLSGCALLAKGHENYTKKIKDVLDNDNKKESFDFEDGGEKILVIDNYRDEYFETTKEKVLAAEYELNRTFVLRGYVSINDFYSYLGIPHINGGDFIGWDMDSGVALYGYQWIDFQHEQFELDDGLQYYNINYPFSPHVSEYLTYENS